MTNIISNQNWLYKPINIDNIEQIQFEFLAILNKYHSDLFSKSWVPNKFHDLNLVTIMQEAPSYVELIKRLGVYDRWSVSYFATVKDGDNQKNHWVVHTDDVDPSRLSFALNIPILNCEDSHTVWYEVKPDAGIKGWVKWYENVPCYLEDAIIKELGRMPATQPAWVNVSLPHRPEVSHTKPRIVLTSRFKPELHDYNFDRLEFAIDR